MKKYQKSLSAGSKYRCLFVTPELTGCLQSVGMIATQYQRAQAVPGTLS